MIQIVEIGNLSKWHEDDYKWEKVIVERNEKPFEKAVNKVESECCGDTSALLKDSFATLLQS